jgi:hypothetical protein
MCCSMPDLSRSCLHKTLNTPRVTNSMSVFLNIWTRLPARLAHKYRIKGVSDGFHPLTFERSSHGIQMHYNGLSRVTDDAFSLSQLQKLTVAILLRQIQQLRCCHFNFFEPECCVDDIAVLGICA